MANQFENKATSQGSEKGLDAGLRFRFVSPVEFISLLVSRSNLERSAESDLEITGLRDKCSGYRYLIEHKRLGLYR